MGNESNDDNVKVVVRCRPLNSNELKQGFKPVLKVDEIRGNLTITDPNSSSGEPPKQFTFDYVFGPESKQVDIYNKIARKIVDSVIDGYNGTIFAYGQTGTGKTFTMEGNRSVPELRGIIPNSFAHIFGHIAKAEANIRFLVRVSYLEIYNEEVRDLLGKDQTARLDVKERPDIGVYVKDLSSFVVHTADEMDKLMTLGNKNRVVGATNMNEFSSRSHAIFSITVERSETLADGRTMLRQGKLHLVDLAGSERQSKTGATGVRLQEANKINLSLSTLGNVISALVDGKSTHVPYRNSKLTRLLQDSLGGNSKTLMVANTGPAGYNYDESLSTLRYANRAKNIQNKAKINEDPKDALLRQFQEEIEKLKKQLDNDGIDDGGESETDESGSEEEVVDENGVTRKVKKRRKKKGGQRISKQKMLEIQQEIEQDRKKLADDKGMEEKERNKVKAHLDARESELQRARDEQNQLTERLNALNKKIIVGGENLLEKAEEQERLLQESEKEIELRRKKEEELKVKLQQTEEERINVEEKYNSLQEESVGKKKKLKKCATMYIQAKSELKDDKEENQREIEGLLENVRQLSKELSQHMLVINSYIPQNELEVIESNCSWNEQIGEWQLRCVAYTGNNMRKHVPQEKNDSKYIEPPLDNVYLYYTKEGEKSLFQPTGKKTAKSASASNPRPKTGNKSKKPKPSIDSVLR